MRITTFRVRNIRSVGDSQLIELGPVTLLVGRNNAGKSTLLRSIYALQQQSDIGPRHVRFGQETGSIEYQIDEMNAMFHWGANAPGTRGQLTIKFHADTQVTEYLLQDGSAAMGVGPIPAVAPKNFVFPFLAGRKVGGYTEQINKAQATAVGPNLQNLVARVDLLMDPQHPTHGTFLELLNEVIGLRLSAIPSDNGKRIGLWVSPNDAIYLEDMGEGVAQLLGFIANLCVAQQKIFIIEELENDIHPEALKLLLAVIEKRRYENQFVISTHNNIVLRHLGSLSDTRIYEVTTETVQEGEYNLPTSTVSAVGTSAAERTLLLQHLGYELSDLDLWDGWLLLEESSAERIIRDHLIRWFAPALSRVRTIAANGTGDVERTFDALHKLVLFTHLESRYRGRVAVMLDGDDSGLDATTQLRSRFTAWPSTAFDNFSRSDFEYYYPEQFQGRVEAALALKDKARRDAKRALLQDVLLWIDDNDPAAKDAFRISASEVCDKLNAFEKALGPAASLA